MVLLCATLAVSNVVSVPVALSLVLGANLGRLGFLSQQGPQLIIEREQLDDRDAPAITRLVAGRTANCTRQPCRTAPRDQAPMDQPERRRRVEVADGRAKDPDGQEHPEGSGDGQVHPDAETDRVERQ